MTTKNALEIVSKGYRIRDIVRTLRDMNRKELRKRNIIRIETLARHFSTLMNDLHNATFPNAPTANITEIKKAHAEAWPLWIEIQNISARAIGQHQEKYARSIWEQNLDLNEWYRYFIEY